MASQNCPDVDTSEELEEGEASYFHSFSWVFRWIVELGHVDICVEVLMLSSHLDLPQVGHLEQLFHIFS